VSTKETIGLDDLARMVRLLLDRDEKHKSLCRQRTPQLQYWGGLVSQQNINYKVWRSGTLASIGEMEVSSDLDLTTKYFSLKYDLRKRY